MKYQIKAFKETNAMTVKLEQQKVKSNTGFQYSLYGQAIAEVTSEKNLGVVRAVAAPRMYSQYVLPATTTHTNTYRQIKTDVTQGVPPCKTKTKLILACDFVLRAFRKLHTSFRFVLFVVLQV